MDTLKDVGTTARQATTSHKQEGKLMNTIISYWVIIKELDNTNGVAFERCYATYNEAYAMQSDLAALGITSNIKKDTIEVA